jgi:HPt (histidine-containing phosphotransfer) domain-containing protein
MDMRMPEMDGLQATRAIRTRGGRLATVPIIAFTANAFAEDMQACRDAGMNDFVVKPVRKTVLIETIARALATTKLRAAEELLALEAPAIAPAQSELAVPDEATPGDAESVRDDPIIDLTVYNELVEEIGEETTCEMLDVFVEETAAQLAQLNQLSCLNDCRQIERLSHSLKGASGTFGLKRLSALARALEGGAVGMSDPEFRAALIQIEQAFDAARSQLPAQFSPAK